MRWIGYLVLAMFFSSLGMIIMAAFCAAGRADAERELIRLRQLVRELEGET